MDFYNDFTWSPGLPAPATFNCDTPLDVLDLFTDKELLQLVEQNPTSLGGGLFFDPMPSAPHMEYPFTPAANIKDCSQQYREVCEQPCAMPSPNSSSETTSIMPFHPESPVLACPVPKCKAALEICKTKRRRSRKAKLNGLIDALTQIQQQMSALSTENFCLKEKTCYLESAIACRDQQIMLMGHCAEASPEPVCVSSTAWHGAYSSPCLSPSPSSSCDSGAKEGQLGVVVKSFQSAGVDVKSSVTMTSEQFRTQWREFLTAASNALLLLETQHDEAAATELLTPAKRKAGCLLMTFATLNPINTRQLMVSSMDPATTNLKAPDEQYWQQVAASIKFTPEEAHKLSNLYIEFSNSIGKLLQDREQLVKSLGRSLAGLLSSSTPRQTCESSQMKPAEIEQLRCLQQNMSREFSQLVLLGCMFYSGLTVLQFARLAVQSYPHFPDHYAVIRAVHCSMQAPTCTSQQIPCQQSWQMPVMHSAYQAMINASR